MSENNDWIKCHNSVHTNIINNYDKNIKKQLKEIIKQLRACKYTCEAGPLEKNSDFIKLAEMGGIKLLSDGTFKKIK